MKPPKKKKNQPRREGGEKSFTRLGWKKGESAMRETGPRDQWSEEE